MVDDTTSTLAHCACVADDYVERIPKAKPYVNETLHEGIKVYKSFKSIFLPRCVGGIYADRHRAHARA
jgi:hypothetical protein